MALNEDFMKEGAAHAKRRRLTYKQSVISEEEKPKLENEEPEDPCLAEEKRLEWRRRMCCAMNILEGLHDRKDTDAIERLLNQVNFEQTLEEMR
eukprot:6023215-Amphidinium_carterae.1